MIAVEARKPSVPGRLLEAVSVGSVVAVALGLGVLGGSEPGIALVLALAGLAGVVCLARPDAATAIVVATLYSNAAAVAVGEHGLPYFVAIAFPVPLVIPLAYHLVVRRAPVTVTAAFPFLVAYLIVQLVGTTAARDARTAFDQLVEFSVTGFGLYFVLTNVVRSLDHLARLIWLVLLVGAGLGALSLWQSVTGTYGDDYAGFAQVNLPGLAETITADVQGTPRLEGPIGEVNRYAQIMLVLLPIAGVLVASRRGAGRVLPLVLGTLIFVGMAATFSRGATLGLGVVVLLGVALRYLRPWHLGLVILGFAILLATSPRYAERLLNLQAITRLDAGAGGGPVQGDVGNLRSRATESLAALLAFTDHPLVGVGPGLFPSYYQQYAREVSAASIDTRIDIGNRQAHNLYVHVAAETGTLGLLAFLAIPIVTIRELVRGRRRWLLERPELAHLLTGLALAVVAYLVSGLFLHLAYERYYWLLMALAGIAGHLALQVPERGAPATPRPEGAPAVLPGTDAPSARARG